MNTDKYFQAFKIHDIKEISLKELHRRFRILAKKYHPDKGGTAAQFRFINDAYIYIKDRVKEYQKEDNKKFFNPNLYFYSDGSVYSKIKNRWVKVKGKKVDITV